MIVTVATPNGLSTNALDRKIFFTSLIAVTSVPLLLLPLHDMHVDAPINSLIMLTWIVAGYSHVMATMWFGIDEEYRPVIATNRMRMIGSLAIIPAAMAAIAVASVAASSWIYAAYTMWLAHHYNRQNFGLVAFAAVNDQAGVLPREVGWMFNLTTGAGAISMAAMPSIYPGGISPFADPAFAFYGRVVAGVLMIAAAVVLIKLLLRNPQLKRCPMVLTFLGLGFAFYLPALLGGPSQVSFWPYAMAHGLQYLLMMSVVARGSRLGLAGLAMFAVMALALGVLVFGLGTAPWAQLYTGIVMWHFLADARLWRLRDPLVRNVVKERFAFLFPRAPV